MDQGAYSQRRYNLLSNASVLPSSRSTATPLRISVQVVIGSCFYPFIIHPGYRPSIRVVAIVLSQGSHSRAASAWSSGPLSSTSIHQVSTSSIVISYDLPPPRYEIACSCRLNLPYTLFNISLSTLPRLSPLHYYNKVHTASLKYIETPDSYDAHDVTRP